MKITVLPDFNGYREQVAGVVFRRTGKRGIEFLLVGRGVEHGWQEDWWDFAGGGIDDCDYSKNEVETLEKAVLRELKEELGLGLNAFGQPMYTGITRTAPFRSKSAQNMHPYSGKQIYYVTIPFFGNDAEIKLQDRITRTKWVQKGQLVEAVRPETKPTAARIARLERTYFTMTKLPYGPPINTGVSAYGLDDYIDVLLRAKA